MNNIEKRAAGKRNGRTRGAVPIPAVRKYGPSGTGRQGDKGGGRLFVHGRGRDFQTLGHLAGHGAGLGNVEAFHMADELAQTRRVIRAFQQRGQMFQPVHNRSPIGFQIGDELAQQVRRPGRLVRRKFPPGQFADRAQIIGGLGGDRFDHSMANLDVLLYISKRGGSAVLCTEDTKVFVVRCGRIVLTELKGATVSVFPFDGSSCNLTYEGLQYPLEKKDLSAGSSLMGVSNCIISDRAEIRVNIGCALVIVYTPKDMPAEPPQSEIQSRLPETEDKKDTEK